MRKHPFGVGLASVVKPRYFALTIHRLITDLNRWSIYALIGTASYYQALALREALFKHLAFENFIAVTFPVGIN